MRLLANENVPTEAVEVLRSEGHDVLWIRTASPGSPDQVFLARAVAESRALLIFDKDFGELAFRSRLPATCGILLFRIRQVSGDYIARHVAGALRSRSDWTGYFSVIDETLVRMTPMPPHAT